MRLLLNSASKAWQRRPEDPCKGNPEIGRRAFVGCLAVATLGFGVSRASAGGSGDVSDWVVGPHARVRLIDAGPDQGRRLAGVEIQLDPGYLTYWRTPGEAGLPPTADFSGSQNLAGAVLRFPAPARYDEAGVEAFGYRDQVIFPVDVVPADPHGPVTLAVALSFAVCANLCLPANAALRLALGGSGQKSGSRPGARRAAAGSRPAGLDGCGGACG